MVPLSKPGLIIRNRKYLGYKAFARYVSSDDDFLALRRFDRVHCLQYMTAVPLAFGNLVAEQYEDEFHAAHPIIDELGSDRSVSARPP